MEIGRSTPFNIKLAGVAIRIEPMYEYIRDYCKDYITKEKESFVVRTEPEDMIYERECLKKEVAEAYLETLSVYRKIAEKLPFYNVLLFHGSVIAVDGEGYLFAAKSGTGKSTHTGLWREYFGGRAVMVNDDKPLLEVTGDGIMAYGTPWNGKNRLSTNISVSLKAICILTRDVCNHIEEIGAKEIYYMLLQQSYRPVNNEAVVQTLGLIDRIMNNIRFYRMGCNMDIDAVEVAYFGMRNNN